MALGGRDYEKSASAVIRVPGLCASLIVVLLIVE